MFTSTPHFEKVNVEQLTVKSLEQLPHGSDVNLNLFFKNYFGNILKSDKINVAPSR